MPSLRSIQLRCTTPTIVLRDALFASVGAMSLWRSGADAARCICSARLVPPPQRRERLNSLDRLWRDENPVRSS